MLYCANCGVEVKEQQKFCEICGSSIPTSVKQSETSTTSSTTASTVESVLESYDRPGGLFDLNRNYYILKEKYRDMGNGEILDENNQILDENNQIIGKMRRIILSIRRRVELLEIDGTLSATIHSKIVSARGAQDLKDPQGNMIARIKKKILSVFRPMFFLEDPQGNRWYEAQGKFMGCSYKVTDMSGKLIAEIEKADKWRDVFLSGLLDFKDTYVLRILDNETDRRILVGFVLSIDNVLHDF